MLVLIGLHVIVFGARNDDLYYKSLLDNYDVFDLVKFFYSNWSSRIPIDIATAIFTRIPAVWALIDVAVFFGIGAIVSSILNEEQMVSRNYLLLFLFVLFPIRILFQAGSVACTTAYVWPLGGALFFAYVVYKRLKEGRSFAFLSCLAFVPLVYASFMQQTALLIFLCTSVFVGLVIIKQKSKRVCLEVIGICVSLGGLIFAFTCPGNASRVSSETATWMPGFATLNIVEKGDLGLKATFYELYCRSDVLNVYYLFFCIAVSLVLFRTRKTFWMILSCVPFLASLLFNLVGFFSNDILVTWLRDVTGPNHDVALRFSDYLISALLVFPLLSIPLLCSVVAMSAIKRRFAICYAIILIAGFLSRIAMGFSPTAYASKDRTMLLLYFAMLVGLYEYGEFVIGGYFPRTCANFPLPDSNEKTNGF